MFEHPKARPEVSVRGDEFIIAVPLKEIVTIAENCPMMPAKVTDAAKFGAYVAGWLEKHITEVKDAVEYAAREVLEDAAYVGAGIQMVIPPYEDYIDRMWASTEGGMVEPRAAAFWKVNPRYRKGYSSRDCVVATVYAYRANDHELALDWLRAGWPRGEMEGYHWEVVEMHEEALEYANKAYGRYILPEAA